MIKTLRITGIIAAVLAGGLLIFPFIFGFRRDTAVEQFLEAPGVVDEFRNAAGRRGRPQEGQASPLVTQAKLFAEYLNPRPEPVRAPRPARQGPTSDKPRSPVPPSVSAKFTVLGTSCNQSRPEESLALIDEPGKGVHWVRQSGKVGHLTLEIQDGLVLARAANKTFEMPVQHKPRISLLAGSSSPQAPSGPKPAPSLLQDTSRGRTRPVGTEPVPTSAPERPMGAEEKAALEKIMAELQAGSAERTAEPKAPAMDRILAQLEALKQSKSNKVDAPAGAEEAAAQPAETDTARPEAGRITGAEASNLEHLGQELDKASGDEDRARILRERRDLRKRRAEMLRRRIERARNTASNRRGGDQ